MSAGTPPKAFLDGHFYSPVVDIDSVRRREARIWPTDPEVLGIDFDPAGHRGILANAFALCLPGFDYPWELPDTRDLTSFYVNNSQFGFLDCRLLFVLLRHWRPRRFIEVGSGYSSLLVADVNRRFLDGAMAFTSIEPYPRPFLKEGIAGLTRLIVQEVQDVDLSLFATLEAGDVLFIDSSHVCKTGSDVNYLYFEVLPRLAKGVRIHIHDIFLPDDYPKDWVFDGRHWNEQYLLRALLMHSTAFRVVFGCAYAYRNLAGEIRAALASPDGAVLGGGSLWIERT